MDIAKIIGELENSISIFEDLIASIPQDRLAMSFGEDIWTIQENVQHLALTQIMLQKRIQLFLTQSKPEIVPFIPAEQSEKQAPKPIPELLALHKAWCDKQIESIRKADSAVWQKQGIHPQYSEYTFSILVRHILLHDYYHYYRIEELGFLKPANIKPM